MVFMASYKSYLSLETSLGIFNRQKIFTLGKKYNSLPSLSKNKFSKFAYALVVCKLLILFGYFLTYLLADPLIIVMFQDTSTT